MMVDRPGVAVQVEPAKHWSATGPLADRAMGFAQRMAATIGHDKRTAFRVAVEHAPREHTGLGVGTQLGLAVAKAIAVESGHAEWSAVDLAARIGRGERSAIGVHGFDRGGLIVDGGKLPNEAVSPLAGRFDVPANWAVLLFTPPVRDGLAWRTGARRTGPIDDRRQRNSGVVPAGSDWAAAGTRINGYRSVWRSAPRVQRSCRRRVRASARRTLRHAGRRRLRRQAARSRRTRRWPEFVGPDCVWPGGCRRHGTSSIESG